MGAAVENGERAVGCLTAERQLGEASGDVRGKAADRAERGLSRRRTRDGDRDDQEMLNAEC